MNFVVVQVDYVEIVLCYEFKELCEQEYGVGNCGGDQVQQLGGGMGLMFMLLLMGYMMGLMLLGGCGVNLQLLVCMVDGCYLIFVGNQSFVINCGVGQVLFNVFQCVFLIVGKLLMIVSQVNQCGGFGVLNIVWVVGSGLLGMWFYGG